MKARQTAAILWMELRKNFITKRGFWIYALALLTPAIVWAHSIVTMHRDVMRAAHDIAKDTSVLAILFQVFFLRPSLFFGCMGIFTYLFRGEVVERSLHYYFLAPVRRELLVSAKFLAGVVTACTFFGLSIVLTFWGMYVHFPQFQVREWLFSGPGLQQGFAYASITLLACLAWGSIFLWMGIRFRNPIIPAVVLLTWESFNVFLPSYLRRVGVLHYLQSLSPVNAEVGPKAILGTTAEPESVAVAVFALLVITAAMLWLSTWQLRRTEISYSTD